MPRKDLNFGLPDELTHRSSGWIIGMRRSAVKLRRRELVPIHGCPRNLCVVSSPLLIFLMPKAFANPEPCGWRATAYPERQLVMIMFTRKVLAKGSVPYSI